MNYQLLFWINTAIIVILLSVIILVTRKIKRGRNRKLYMVVQELRKNLRIYHQKQASLFKSIDEVLLLVPPIYQKEKEEKRRWDEYGQDRG